MAIEEQQQEDCVEISVQLEVNAPSYAGVDRKGHAVTVLVTKQDVEELAAQFELLCAELRTRAAKLQQDRAGEAQG